MPSGGGGAGGARRSAASPLPRSSEARSHGPITPIPLTDMATAIRPTAMRRLTATAMHRPTATATHRLTATATHRLTVTSRPTTHGDPITATTDVINGCWPGCRLLPNNERRLPRFFNELWRRP